MNLCVGLLHILVVPPKVQQSHLTQRYQFGLENSLKVTSLEINVCQVRLYLPPGALFMLIGENECLRMTLRKVNSMIVTGGKIDLKFMKG